MADTTPWVDIIYAAIDERNDLATDAPKIEKSEQTVLVGEDGLDSLAFVSLIVSVEEKVQDASDTIIALADERAFSRPESPFRTVSTLATYIDELVREETGG